MQQEVSGTWRHQNLRQIGGQGRQVLLSRAHMLLSSIMDLSFPRVKRVCSGEERQIPERLRMLG